MSLHVFSETPWYDFLVTWRTFENSKTSSALELLTVKHVHIICYMLSFPSTFMVLYMWRFWIDKKGKKLGCFLSLWRIRMNAIWILRTYVFLTHLWHIGTSSSRAVKNWYQLFTMWNLRSVKFTVQQSLYIKNPRKQLTLYQIDEFKQKKKKNSRRNGSRRSGTTPFDNCRKTILPADK